MTRAWGFARPILIAGLLALGAPLLAAPGAHADVLSCATEGGVGPVTPGVQSISNDVGDTLFTEPLLDTDNGVSYPHPGWEDGVYEYHDFISRCLAVDTNGPGDDGANDTGLYSAVIDSFGAYDNTICGTGLWIDRGPVDSTTVDLTPIQALGPGEDITDANYAITFTAGAGTMGISASTGAGETMTGDGMARLSPAVGNCVTTDVSAFDVTVGFRLGSVMEQL